jgi:hypothetical protein
MIARVSVHFPCRRGALLLAALSILLCSAASAFASSGPPSQTVEHKLRVKVESASVRLKPDPGSPIIGVLKRGTILMSYDSEGGWYRVVPGADKDAISLVGYIAATDVDMIEERTVQRGNFWSEEESTYAGIGLEFFMAGGYAIFAGADFTSGVRGLYDELKSHLIGLGFPISNEKNHAFNGGMQLTAELFLRLSRRLAVGLAGDYALAQRFDEILFEDGGRSLGATSSPILRTFVLRPGLRYGVFTGGPVRLSVTAGPALFLSSFKYNRGMAYDYVDFLGTTSKYSHTLKASRTYLGAFAAVDAEVHLVARASIVLQAIYRFSRAAGWEGSEETFGWESGWGVGSEPEVLGRLAVVARGPAQVLAVPSASSGSGAREAVLDYSGLSLSAGLRIRF